MSADLLRRAATVLRERAEKATPGAWKVWGMSVMADTLGDSNVDHATDVARTLYRDDRNMPRTFDAHYIATVYPGVGLALADWLDSIADIYNLGISLPMVSATDVDATAWAKIVRSAKDVARAILGGDA